MGDFKRSQYFNFEMIILKVENFFQKIEVLFLSLNYCNWKSNISRQN